MRKLLVLALLFIMVQPVYAHGLKEKPLRTEEGGYSLELITEPKYPVIWKKTTFTVIIEKEGRPFDGRIVTFAVHGPGHEGEVLINAAPQGSGIYTGKTTFQEQGEYEIHVGFDENQGAFKLKVDGLGRMGVLRGLIVILIIGALIAKSMKSCRGGRNAED